MRILMLTAMGFQAASLLMTLLLPDFNLKSVDETRDYSGMIIGQVRESKAKQEAKVAAASVDDTKEIAV